MYYSRHGRDDCRAYSSGLQMTQRIWRRLWLSVVWKSMYMVQTEAPGLEATA